MIEVNLSAKCLDCSIKMKEDNFFVYCSSCVDHKYRLEDIKEAIENVLENDFTFDDKENYSRFECEKDRDLFLSGMKNGFIDALFWLTNYFGISDEFDDRFTKILEKNNSR
jgi:hypothetical protein